MSYDSELPLNTSSVRFAVRRSGYMVSSVWHAWMKRDQYYVASDATGGHYKVSLHQSERGRVSRIAFTEERYDRYAERLPKKNGEIPDRAITKVNRTPTPVKGVVFGLQLILPTNYMLHAKELPTEAPNKPIIWLDAAPEGKAILVNFIYTLEPAHLVEPKLSRKGKILARTELSTGEAVYIVASESGFDQDVTPLINQHVIHPLSDELSKLAVGESLNNLGATIMNDATADGVPVLLEVNGMSITRT